MSQRDKSLYIKQKIPFMSMTRHFHNSHSQSLRRKWYQTYTHSRTRKREDIASDVFLRAVQRSDFTFYDACNILNFILTSPSSQIALSSSCAMAPLPVGFGLTEMANRSKANDKQRKFQRSTCPGARCAQLRSPSVKQSLQDRTDIWRNVAI